MLTRRDLLIRTGLASLAAAILPACEGLDPGTTTPDQLLDDVLALLHAYSRDTFNGVAALVLPGDDVYSKAQGETHDGPGGVALRGADIAFDVVDTNDLSAMLGNLVAYYSSKMPVDLLGDPINRLADAIHRVLGRLDRIPESLAVALALNLVAYEVSPPTLLALPLDGIMTPFSRLKVAEKIKVFELLETGVSPTVQVLDQLLPEPLRYSVSGLVSYLIVGLPAIIGFAIFSEFAVFDPDTHEITGTPQGWAIAHYQPDGPVEGWNEFKGYYQGRKEVDSLMRDVIVIGAGGGGPVVAKELAARGLDVLLLEGGPRHGEPEKEWSHNTIDANHLTKGYLRFGPADRKKLAWPREVAGSGYILQLSGVGGTTQHYFANSPRAMPGVFAGYSGADKDEYDTKHRFPFSYDDLRPYYEWVEATLPVQTAPMGTKEEVFFRGCEGIGLPLQTTKDITRNTFRPQENAILQPGGNAGKTTKAADLRYPFATGCTFCGSCISGCYQPIGAPRNLKAKRSTDNSYVPMALTADAWHPGGKPVTLLADAFAVRIHVDKTASGANAAKAVTFRIGATGEKHTEEARVVVLSAGCTEGPRLWMNSDLPNPYDWVGRGYTTHYSDQVVAKFPFYTGETKGAASSSRADFPGYGVMEQIGIPPSFLAAGLLLSDSGFRGHYDNGRGFVDSGGAWDGASGRVFGNELREMLGDANKTLNIVALVDDDVEWQNRVVTSGIYTDEHGPAAKFELRQRQVSARTTRNREFLTQTAAKIMRAAGATKVLRVDSAPIVVHFQSTMRMGDSLVDSVVDPNGRSWFVESLYVADNSALSNSLGGPNPTLTTQALATRTAEKIFAHEFGGERWVGREAPVSSIDDRVTGAVLSRGIT